MDNANNTTACLQGCMRTLSHPTPPFQCPLQVSQDGKALLDVLQRPLSPGDSESLTATANYSKAVHCILDVVHEVLHHQRRLESLWQHRKVRLHQRLQLCVFQQDVQQVRETPKLQGEPLKWGSVLA